jgi:hypothetical protein
MGQHGMVPSQGGMPYSARVYAGGDQHPFQRIGLGSQPQGMFTRNLIGSLATNAQRLADMNDKIGIWFILQDLSVRTEGSFR